MASLVTCLPNTLRVQMRGHITSVSGFAMLSAIMRTRVYAFG